MPHSLLARLAVWVALGAILAPVCISQSPAPITSDAAQSASARPVVGGALVSQLQTLLAELHVVGAVVVIVRDGQPVLLEGLGVRDLASGAPVNPESTVFQVASVSKSITATAIASLAAKGLLDLDTDINVYLKSFKVPATFDKPITLGHLLTHSAGLSERNLGFVARTASEVPPLADYLRDRLPPRFAPPGLVFSYSNHGLGLAALAASEATGVPFDRFIRDEVLLPLGMTRSTFALPLPAELAADAASGYRVVNGSAQKTPDAFRNVAPAGGFSTTARDMASFMIAHLEADPSPTAPRLDPRVLELTHTPAFLDRTAAPGVCRGFFEQIRRGHRGLGHPGQTLGFTAALLLFPSDHVGVFVACNSSSPEFPRRATALLLDSLFGPEPEQARAVTTHATSPIAPLGGAYRTMRSGYGTLENIASLFAGQAFVESHDTTISINGSDYHPGADGVWVASGPLFARFFPAHDSLPPMMLATSNFAGVHVPTMFEKLSYLDAPRTTNEFWLSWLLIFGLLGVLWPLALAIGAIIRRARFRRALVNQPAAPRGLAWASASLAALLGVLMFLTAAGPIRALVHAAQSGGGELIFGAPTWFRVMLWFPPVSILSTLALLIAFAMAWRRPSPWTLRIPLFLFVCVHLLWCRFLIHWDLGLPIA